MKALVVFDTNYGNTKKIAEIVSNELGIDSETISVSAFSIDKLEGIELLVVGSPVIAFRPSVRMGKFLSNLSYNQLKGIKATSFDTRIKSLMSGDAAKKISVKMRKAGAEIIISPEVFFVTVSADSPLLFDGEKEKAIEWAKSIKAAFEK